MLRVAEVGTKNTRKFAFTGTEFNIAFNGCHKCDQVGKKIGKRTAFWNHSEVLRTDESFRLREDLEHHNIMENSSIESLNIKNISLVVLDPMHLIDIGVMKKMLINNLSTAKSSTARSSTPKLSTAKSSTPKSSTAKSSTTKSSTAYTEKVCK